MGDTLTDIHKRGRGGLANGLALAADCLQPLLWGCDWTARRVAQQHMVGIVLFNKSTRRAEKSSAVSELVYCIHTGNKLWVIHKDWWNYYETTCRKCSASSSHWCSPTSVFQFIFNVLEKYIIDLVLLSCCQTHHGQFKKKNLNQDHGCCPFYSMHPHTILHNATGLPKVRCVNVSC